MGQMVKVYRNYVDKFWAIVSSMVKSRNVRNIYIADGTLHSFSKEETEGSSREEILRKVYLVTLKVQKSSV